MNSQLPGVSRTAVWVASLRAAETRRADKLFDDALAREFVSAAGGAPETNPVGTVDFLAIRTRFYDDRLLAACAEGIRQVVLLAAGFDARAFRLAWPAGVRLFELDLPELFGFKETVLTAGGAIAACARVIVPADLRGNWADALEDAGFDRSARTAWIAEGLFPYLGDVEGRRL